MASIIDDIAERLGRGVPLEEDDALALWRTHDLVRLGMLADEARRRRQGGVTTYVRVADVALADVGRAEWPETSGEIRVTATAAALNAQVAAIEGLVKRAGAVPVTVGHLEEFAVLGSSYAPSLRRLADAGVAGIACAAVDRLPDAVASLSTALDAGLIVARLVVDAASTDGPWSVLERVRAVQRATGAVKAFAPLPRRVDDARPTTGYADAKTVALARLVVGEVPVIQVDWQRYGAKLCQVALLFGANDIDAVSPSDDTPTGWRRAPVHEIVRNIEAAALTPCERDGRFARRVAEGAAPPVGRRG